MIDHAANQALHLELTGTKPRRRRRDSFWDWVDRPAIGCWLWRGRRTSGGYGIFTVNGRTFLAHRFAWEMVNGDVPPETPLLRHSDDCVARHCVRPSHLTPGTNRDNADDMMRQRALGTWRSGRTWREEEAARRRADAVMRARMAGFEDEPSRGRRGARTRIILLRMLHSQLRVLHESAHKSTELSTAVRARVHEPLDGI